MAEPAAHWNAPIPIPEVRVIRITCTYWVPFCGDVSIMNGICWKIHSPSETLVLNVILGDTLIHGNTYNQRKLLADVNVTPPISACQIT